MKKKFELYCSSFKASACTKPTVLLVFILLIIVFTMALGFPMRLIFENVETELFGTNFMLEELDRTKPIDYSNYKDIAEKLEPINDKNLFDAEHYYSALYMKCNKPNITKQDGQQLEYKSIRVCIEMSPFLFTQEELNANTQKIMGSKNFFKENNLKQGDKLIFEGSEFILYENHKNDNTLTIAYTANIKDFKYSTVVDRTPSGEILGDVKFYSGKIYIYGKQNIARAYELDILKSIGLRPYPPNFGGLILPMIIFSVILIGGILSILIVYSYIIEINSRRYAIYKIIGTPPRTISCIMLAESLVLSSIGVGLGLMIEIIVNLITKIDVLMVNRLMWLHCISLVAVTVLATLMTVGIKIFKHAKAVPVAVKYLQ